MAAKAILFSPILTGKQRSRRPAVSRNGNPQVIVQPEYFTINAVESAHYEEAKTQEIQRKKEAKLLKFQEDVKRRVEAMEREKRKQELERSYQAVEDQRQIVSQSSAAAEKTTPRKNRCFHRQDDNLAIRHRGIIRTQGGFVTDSGSDTENRNAFQVQKTQVEKFTQFARRSLTSRRIIPLESYPDELPGGVWREGATMDTLTNKLLEQKNSGNDIYPKNDLEDDDDEKIDNEKAVEEFIKKSVNFIKDSPRGDTREDRIARKTLSARTISGTDLERPFSVPNIYPGVKSKEDKLQAVTQRAMYRRLFMDIEREQVKENIRRKEHRKRIHRLKKEKEEHRERIEHEAFQMVEPLDPVTGESATDIYQREQELAESLKENEEKEIQRAQRYRDTERYLEALKRNLKEKIIKQNLDLPPLCCCGDSVWDTSPDTCANNCVFYRNPKAYAKALQSLLVSCDVK